MKKVIEVKVRAKTIKATTKEVTEFYCDVAGCGKKITHGNGHECCICDRDVCFDHYRAESDDYGDRMHYYCPICYDLYVYAYEDMKEKYWNEEEKLREDVKNESLAR